MPKLTGTGIPLTAGTTGASTAPTGMSHRTGCSSMMPNRGKTSATIANAAVPGPETTTDISNVPLVPGNY